LIRIIQNYLSLSLLKRDLVARSSPLLSKHQLMTVDTAAGGSGEISAQFRLCRNKAETSPRAKEVQEQMSFRYRAGYSACKLERFQFKI